MGDSGGRESGVSLGGGGVHVVQFGPGGGGGTKPWWLARGGGGLRVPLLALPLTIPSP